MTLLEIILLIIGIIVFVASFLVGSKDSGSKDYEVADKEIKKLIDDKIKEASSILSDKVDDSVDYSVGMAERNMEKVTNEKIMAISEFAESVMEDIHKNHDEVVFMYDMLNDKQTNLKNTVREVEATAKSAKETVTRVKEQAIDVANDQALKTKTSEVSGSENAQQGVDDNQFMPFSIPAVNVKNASDNRKNDIENSLPARKNPKKSPQIDSIPVMPTMITSDDDMESEEEAQNQNEKILSLHRAGKSNMAIAKELGMGVGEVKLVIDLFKEM